MVNLGKAGENLDYLHRYLIEEEIEEYQEQHISRREMVRRVLILTGSIPATASMLLAAGCGTSAAPTTAPASAAPSAGPASSAPAASPAASAAASPTTAPATSTAATTRTSAATTPAGTATRASTVAAGTPGTATRTASPGGTPTGITVSPNDPALDAGPVQFPGQDLTLLGYLASPKAATRAPGLIVIHENRGLTEHIKDVVRRYAKSGFIALAVDLVSRQGGTDKIADPAQIPAFLGNAANREPLVLDMLSAVRFLRIQPKFAGPKMGVVGYCYGGGMTWLLATRSTDIVAANPYYGPPPDPISDVQNIAGPVLAFYGETDSRINQNIPAIEAAMKQYNKSFESKIYPGAGHAFNNDTGQSYNAAAAQDAYQRSVAFFQAKLQG